MGGGTWLFFSPHLSRYLTLSKILVLLLSLAVAATEWFVLGFWLKHTPKITGLNPNNLSIFSYMAKDVAKLRILILHYHGLWGWALRLIISMPIRRMWDECPQRLTCQRLGSIGKGEKLGGEGGRMRTWLEEVGHWEIAFKGYVGAHPFPSLFVSWSPWSEQLYSTMCSLKWCSAFP